MYDNKIEKVKKYRPGLLGQYQAGQFTQNRSVMEQLYLLQQMSNAYSQSKDKAFADELTQTLQTYTNALKKI